MLNWIFGKKLEDVLGQTKKVKVQGVRFVIRKLSPLHYLDGSKVLQASYEIYKTSGNSKLDEVSAKKIKEHYAQTLVAGVVSPKLTLKEGDEGQSVEALLDGAWELAEELYLAIMEYTYGKKKLRQSLSQEKRSRS
jgi:hypothetical protein